MTIASMNGLMEPIALSVTSHRQAQVFIVRAKVSGLVIIVHLNRCS